MRAGFIQELIDESTDLQIAPMIDCVFLLLIYFMVAASLHRTEADLGISLPGTVVQAQAVQMPDEQIIEIEKSGRIVLNSKVYDEGREQELPELTRTLIRYRLAAEAAKTKALITVQAHDEVPHQRVIDVMNACAGAGIKYVSFGMGQ